MSITALSQRTLNHLEIIQSLRSLFSISANAEEFLYTHSELADILKEAKKHIETHFGNSKLALDVIRNETGEVSQLFLKILTPFSVEESNQRLQALDEEWTLDNTLELDNIIIDVVYH